MKKSYKHLVFILGVAAMLAACSLFTSLNMAISNQSRETGPSVLERDIQDLVKGNNAFAFDVYQSLRSQNGNLILSPYSISLALAMPYAGARGDTETQMAQTLRFSSHQKSED